MPITITAIPDQVTAINTATGAIAFTVARSPIVATVPALAYLATGTVIDLGTDAAALGVEVGSGLSGHGIPSGALVDSITGDTVTSDLAFTADGDGTAITFAPPISGVTVTARSYDPVRIASVVLGGSGATRTVTVTPATAKSGRATIEVKAVAGSQSATETFLLTTTPAVGTYTVPGTWEAQEIGPVLDVDEFGEKGTLTFIAPYPACKTVGNAAYRPNPGVAIAGLAGMVVGTVKIEPKSAVGDGVALVTITLVPPEKSEGTDSEGEPIAVHFRCRWENEMKPINTADIYVSGAQQLTDEDLYDIEMWKQEPNSTLRRAYKFREELEVKELSPHAQHYADKVKGGTESYPLAYPVVSKVGLTKLSLAFATSMNKVYPAPPGFPKDTYPPGWLWVGCEDDRDQYGRTGPKEGTVSFRGVSEVDGDFYKGG